MRLGRLKRGRSAGLIGASAVSALVVVLALSNPGVPKADVELDDAGVWVTNQERRLVGHLNHPSHELDAALRAPSEKFDVSQVRDDVVLRDLAGNQGSSIDVGKVVLEESFGLPGGAIVAQGGERTGIFDPASGRGWVMANADATSFSTEMGPIVNGAKGGVMAMGVDGTMHVASTSLKKVLSFGLQGSIANNDEGALKGMTDPKSLQVSAVGASPVVLDGASGQLRLPDGTLVKLPGEGWKLQQPGPEADDILVSSRSALLRVPLGGGTPAPTPNGGKDSAAGAPAAPVMVGECAYAAWGEGSGRFLRDCPGKGKDEFLSAERLDKAEELVFRVNRKVVVLNEIRNGTLWLPDKKMLLVDDWEKVNSQVEKEKEEDSNDTSRDQAKPERSEKNHPPQAIADKFGVRPGGSAILPVLWNDSDSDGDVLTVKPTGPASIGTVTQVRAGEALQIAVPAGASGASTFQYMADDGRGGTATAAVTVEIHPTSQNAGPKQLRPTKLLLTQSANAEHNVLGDWIDPDGDPVFLEGFKPSEGIEGRTRQDGTMSLRVAPNAKTGPRDLTIMVSDGKATTEGKVLLDIRENKNLAPTANGDHVTARVGEGVAVSPLVNDTDPNGDTLSLNNVGVSVPTGVVIEPNLKMGSFSVNAKKPGTYYVPYTVSDGPNAGPGIVRVDAVAATEAPKPIAEPDFGLLQEGGSVLLGVLDNDSDPEGQVLAIQSVDVPPTSGLVVAVIEHRVLRISAPRGLKENTNFKYTVSNGKAAATADVTIVPIPATSTDKPPIVEDDRTKVRVGDVASIRVLDNDRSPAGLKLHVKDELIANLPAEAGTAFVSDDRVRFRAGNVPGIFEVNYTAVDSNQNAASAKAVFEVMPLDPAANEAPRPKEVTARVLAGKSARIPIPLEGIDPDGDSVVVTGIDTPATLGVAEVGSGWITFTASPEGAGTDTFTYLVEDKFGKQASAAARVAVVPMPETNAAPIPQPDTVMVRPSRQVAAIVLGNDTDPDGDDLNIKKESLQVADGLDARIRSQRIAFTSPSKDGAWTVGYTVEDGRGGESNAGLLTVNVKKDAPLLTPIARDDAVGRADIAGKSSVTIPVLDNDEDPDGDARALTLSSSDAGVSVSGNNDLVVKVQKETQQIIYTVTDMDGQKASAIVRVPGSGDERPYLDTTKMPLEVKAGQKLEIPLDDYIVARKGRTVRITDPDKVKAAFGHDGSSLVKEAKTLVFGADAAFAGMSALSAEVIDGDLNDATALRASVTMPVKVISNGNHPPRFTPTRVEVGTGDDPVKVNLAMMVQDPDGTDPTTMKYTVGTAPSGITAKVSGNELTLSAASGTSKGHAGDLEVTVNDGGTPVKGKMPIWVVSSTKPPIMISPIEITDGVVGKASSVDVSRYATNPFPGKPLRIIGQPTVAGAGTASASGTTVSITPSAKADGQLRINFRLGDATNDPDREVDGVINMAVRERPDPPLAVRGETTSNGDVQVSWTAGSANGSPIESYSVQASGGGGSKSCGAATTCLISGLTMGNEYSFTVKAKNAVGESDPSAPSASMRVDVKPGPPTGLRAVARDGAVDLTWGRPSNKAKVVNYRIYTCGQGERTVTGTSYTITGIRNGTNCEVQVFAINSNNEVSEPASASEIPFGAPFAPTNMTAETQNLGQSSSGQAQIRVTWSPADGNGRPVDNYLLTADGRAMPSVPGSTNSTVINVPFSQKVQLRLTAKTKHPTASPAATASVSAYGKPPAPRLVSAKPIEGQDWGVEVNVSGAAGNGWDKGNLTYRVRAGEELGTVLREGSNSIKVSRTGPVPVQVYAVGRGSDGTEVKSEMSSSISVNPFATPVTPSISCTSRVDAVHCGWQGGQDNGRATEYSLSNGRIVGPAGDFLIEGLKEGQSAQLCILARHTQGTLRGQYLCASGTAKVFPRNYKAFFGTGISDPIGCPNGGCKYVEMEFWEWHPWDVLDCEVTNWAGKNYKVGIEVDGNGYWKGRPEFVGPGGYLWTASASDLNLITCRKR